MASWLFDLFVRTLVQVSNPELTSHNDGKTCWFFNHKRKFHFHILLPSPKTLSLIRWWKFASFLDVSGHHAEVQLSGFDFHGVLIDEVAQATETSCILAPPHTDTMEIRANWPCLFGQSSCLFISQWQVGQLGPYRRGCCTGSRCLPCCHALQSLVTWYGHCCTSMDQHLVSVAFNTHLPQSDVFVL